MEWRDIKGFEQKYSISKDGQIKSYHTGRIMKTFLSDGYNRIGLLGKNFFIHRLVYITFSENFINDKKYVINHKNGIKTDNNFENLEQITISENAKHAYKIGLYKSKSINIIYDSLIIEIKNKYNNIIWKPITYQKIEYYDYIISTEGSIKNINNNEILEYKNYVFYFKHVVYSNVSIIKILKETFLKEEINPNEIWKYILNSNYQISNLGRVKYSTVKRESILKPKISNGYNNVSIKINKTSNFKTFYIHILVAKTFLINDDTNKTQINHIDGNKLNNKLENLEYVTPSTNGQHAIDNFLTTRPKGSEHINALLTEEQVIEIYYMNGLQKDIAKKFNIKQKHVSSIKCKRNWKHILKDL